MSGYADKRANQDLARVAIRDLERERTEILRMLVELLGYVDGAPIDAIRARLSEMGFTIETSNGGGVQ